MIWLVGTKRIVRVDDTQIPAVLLKYLDMASPDHRDIFGNFEICRLSPDRSGHMGSACVASATSLVVQDRIGHDSSPAKNLAAFYFRNSAINASTC